MLDQAIRIPRLRLALLLWLSGMAGAVVVTVAIVPGLLEQHALPVPLWLVCVASLSQSALLLGLAVWAGVALSPAVRLHAPVFEAVVTARSLLAGLRPQMIPGVTAGALGGTLLFVLSRYAPAALAVGQKRLNLPLVGRVLYGGITEELLLRWGFMTALLWLLWRFATRRRGAPGAVCVALAIVLSALLFGAGHLPAARAMLGHLSASVAGFVVGANTVFGLLFGYLFWRYGLEAAMIAHAAAHLVSYVFDRL